jgi:dolichyl-phosphate-mannose--protein O-mannosyl transferase
MFGASKELQKDHMFSSRPQQWPLMKQGVAYWLDRESNVSYLFQNIILKSLSKSLQHLGPVV